MEQGKKDFQVHVQKERIHLSQVRRAFTKGLEEEDVDPGLINFYVACCDYLDCALNRLITQDHILHDLLVPHVEKDNQEYIAKLEKLTIGLNAMEEAIKKLNTAKEKLIKSGLYEVNDFKKEANAFLDVFLNMLASNRHSTISAAFELELLLDFLRVCLLCCDLAPINPMSCLNKSIARPAKPTLCGLL